MPNNIHVLDALGMQRALVRIAHEIAEQNRATADIVVVGIQRGGVHLARRLAELLAGVCGHPVPSGALDVGMHRDDLDQRSSVPEVFPTTMPFDVNGKTVVLADDVLFSGRTVRAALDAVHDFGRPKAIRLAVLIDRGHRELPIKPDFVGRNVPTSPQERIQVHWKEADGTDGVDLQKL